MEEFIANSAIVLWWTAVFCSLLLLAEGLLWLADLAGLIDLD